jgi:hypothetical protein
MLGIRKTRRHLDFKWLFIGHKLRLRFFVQDIDVTSEVPSSQPVVY